MAALEGSGREKAPDDGSLANYILASRAKNGANSVASDRLSEDSDDRRLSRVQEVALVKRYFRNYESLLRAGSDETIVIPASRLEISRVVFANQVINQQRTLESFGKGDAARKAREAAQKRVSRQ